MKKWYKEKYFNRRNWILDNFDKLSLSPLETMTLLIIDFSKQNNVDINNEYLCTKLKIDSKELDTVLSSLVSKSYLKINVNEKGIFFDIDGLFDEDVDKMDDLDNKNIYEIWEDVTGKPATPNDMMKIKDLHDEYGEEELINAIRMADAYRKYTLSYVEGILKNENK